MKGEKFSSEGFIQTSVLIFNLPAFCNESAKYLSQRQSGIGYEIPVRKNTNPGLPGMHSVRARFVIEGWSHWCVRKDVFQGKRRWNFPLAVVKPRGGDTLSRRDEDLPAQWRCRWPRGHGNQLGVNRQNIRERLSRSLEGRTFFSQSLVPTRHLPGKQDYRW